MPFNGSGTFTSLGGANFPAVPGTTILASQFNNNMNDIFNAGLTNCLTRDGQSPPTANIPMASFKFTSLGNGTADTDSAALGQTLATRGQVGTVDWNTKITNGVFEGTATSLTGPSANFPPTSDLGQLFVIAQGALISQYYVTPNTIYIRRKLSGVWSVWTSELAPGKNYAVNSAFQIWQAGTTVGPVTGKNYVADMCYSNSLGSTYTTSQQAWPIGQTDVDPLAQFFQRTSVTTSAGAGNFCYLEFPMESVKILSARSCTISFYGRGVPTAPVAVSVEQNFGTGGAPSAAVGTAAPANVTLTGTWARYSVTIAIPSISGKTLGTNGDDFLGIRIWLDAGSNFNSITNTLGQQSGQWDFWGVKVEEGTFVTPYSAPSFATELTLCQRYYINTNRTTTFAPLTFYGNVTNASQYVASVQFPAIMRSVPGTIVFFNRGNSNFPAATGTVTSITAYSVAENRTASATAVGFFSSEYSADARY